ncbi:hypothetical protein SK128_005124 [Halocaridina rubra]|uniref:Uncharacterized protein n=1 Tax=Halocaridina rubra TaxID=373956 RepID=A0AAN8XAP8_HALRR
MEDILLCDLCMEEFAPGAHDPLVLLCGHTYCRKCLNEVGEEGSFLCPACRKPHCDVSELPVNYKLLSGIASQKSKVEICDNHGDSMNYWCQDCQARVCVLCIISHHHRHMVVIDKAFYFKKRLALLKSRVQQWRKDSEGRMLRKLQSLFWEFKNWFCDKDIFSRAERDVDNLLTELKDGFEPDSLAVVSSKIENITLKVEEVCFMEGLESEINQMQAVKKITNSYYVQNVDGKQSMLLWQDGKLRMTSFSQTLLGTELLFKMPSEVYLDLSINGVPIGSVIIQPWYHLRRAQQFAALCMGTFGASYLGTSFTEVRYPDQPGELLAGGYYIASCTRNTRQLSASDLMADLEWGGEVSGDFCEGRVFASIINKMPISSGSSTFGICVRTKPGCSLNCPFGEVVSGLDVVKKAVKHWPVNEVEIVGCGMIFANNTFI